MELARDELLDAARRTAAVIGKRPGIPVLSGIRMVPNGDVVTLEATDLETWAEVDVEYTGKATPEVVIEAVKLVKAVEAVKGDTVKIEATGNKVTIGRVGLLTLPATDFPAPAPYGRGTVFQADCRELASGLSDAMKFASRDTARPTLTGVSMEQQDAGLVLVTTDSYRLVIANCEALFPKRKAEGWQWLLPSNAAKVLAKALKGHDGEVVASNAGRSWLRWILPDGSEYATGQIDGQYPNWRQLMPEQPAEGVLMYHRAEMVEAIKNARDLREDRMAPLRIRFGDTPAIEFGEDEFQLDATFRQYEEMAPLKMAVNPDYLLSAVEVTKGAPIEVRGNLKPFQLASENRIALVMPVRLPSPVA